MRARLVLAALIVSGCGARTSLVIPEPLQDASVDVDTAPPPECVTTADCDGAGDLCNPIACISGHCVAEKAVVCDDMDPCTDDSCDPSNGKCVFKAATLDVDGDGHKGPKPGHKAGDPGSCGDDCDDTNPNAFPGNKEVCDGVDNDCNGIVDDNMQYVPPGGGTDDAVRVSELGTAPAEPEGLAFAGGNYLAGYSASLAGKPRVFAARLDPNGTKLAEDQVTKVTADAFEGRVVWNGAAFGVLWSDRRTGSWEMYFNRLTPKGDKLQPDLPVSLADDQWSLDGAMAWTGKEFVTVWQDERDLAPEYSIYGQRIDVDGKLVGANVKLVDGPAGAPQIAVGVGSLGVTWDVLEGKNHAVYAAVFARDFSPLVPPFRVTTMSIRGVYPRIAWNDDRYVVTFHDQDSAKKAVYGMAFDEKGAAVVPLKQLTDSPKSSRLPWALPLGDRMLLVFSDNKDGNAGYELYTKMLDKNLGAISPERRVTNAPGDSFNAIASFGPTGDVGVLFRDDRLKEVHTFFTRLVCVAGM